MDARTPASRRIRRFHSTAGQADGPRPDASLSSSSNGPTKPRPPQRGSPSSRTAAAPARDRPKPGQGEALDRVIHEDGLETRGRAAAILFLVFGQQAEIIARLTRADVTITEELVAIQFGTTRNALPDPLAEPWRELAANPGHDLTAAPPIPSGYSAVPLPGVTSTPDASQPGLANYSVHGPRGSELSTNSPNSHP